MIVNYIAGTGERIDTIQPSFKFTYSPIGMDV